MAELERIANLFKEPTEGGSGKFDRRNTKKMLLDQMAARQIAMMIRGAAIPSLPARHLSTRLLT
jgi:hypothetical protein